MPRSRVPSAGSASEYPKLKSAHVCTTLGDGDSPDHWSPLSASCIAATAHTRPSRNSTHSTPSAIAAGCGRFTAGPPASGRRVP